MNRMFSLVVMFCELICFMIEGVVIVVVFVIFVVILGGGLLYVIDLCVFFKNERVC